MSGVRVLSATVAFAGLDIGADTVTVNKTTHVHHIRFSATLINIDA